MQILRFFESEKTEDCTVYRLRADEWENLLAEIPEHFRGCYIDDAELDSISASNNLPKGDCLARFVLPDKGSIKSGDFGEIFSYFAVTDNFVTKGLDVTGPKKWRWKEDRNDPCHKCDCILVSMSTAGHPSQDDLVVSVESKMKATSSTEHRMQTAIDGASKDRLSRMTKTLLWLGEKYGRLGDNANREMIERFCFPARHGEYSRRYKAIVILDADLEQEEVGLTVQNPEDVTVLAFVIERLKNLYEDTRQIVIDSV